MPGGAGPQVTLQEPGEIRAPQGAELEGEVDGQQGVHLVLAAGRDDQGVGGEIGRVEPDGLAGGVVHLGKTVDDEQDAPRDVSVAGAPDDAHIPAPVDLVMLVDVYHHIDQRAGYFRKLRASLKPGGRIAIIDFRMDAPSRVARLACLAGGARTRELWGTGAYCPDMSYRLRRR